MTDLHERLRRLADDLSDGVQLTAPSGALTAQKRHGRPAFALASLALAALVVIVVLVVPGHTRPLTVTTGPANNHQASPYPLGRIATVALTAADGLGHATSGTVVATTLRRADADLHARTPTGGQSDVFLVVLTGGFNPCSTCIDVSASELLIVLDRGSLTVRQRTLADRTANLSALGPPYRLDLAAALVTVPDLLGAKAARAEQKLHALGLKVSERYVPSPLPRGTVVAESATPVAKVSPGSTIHLAVSTGQAR